MSENITAYAGDLINTEDMTIAENLDRIINAKEAIKEAIVSKGGQVTEDARIDQYPAAIEALPSGGDDSFSLTFTNVGTGFMTVYFASTGHCLVKNLKYKIRNNSWVYLFNERDVYIDIFTKSAQQYLVSDTEKITIECDGIINIGKIGIIACSSNCSVSGYTDVVLTSIVNKNMYGDWSGVVYRKNVIPMDNFSNNTNWIRISKPIDLNNVEYISNGGLRYAYKGNTYITKAIIPTHKNIGERIMESMFSGCTNITEIEGEFCNNNDLSYGMQAYYEMFKGCTKLKKCIDFPKSVYVGSYAFYGTYSGCTSLTESPEIFQTKVGSTAVFQSTFERCTGLLKANPIHMEGSISGATGAMFYGCTSLKEMTWTATTPPTINSSIWTNCPSDMIIYVPDESVDAYKAASVWSSRANYIKPISEKPTE